MYNTAQQGNVRSFSFDDSSLRATGRVKLHIHLDPVGGIAGDMFIAAVADTFPGCKSLIEDTLQQFSREVTCKFSAHADSVLCGTKFKCWRIEKDSPRVRDSQSLSLALANGHSDADHHSHEVVHPKGHAHADEHGEISHSDDHRSYEEIRSILIAANLPEAVQSRALNIFFLIGEAEAEVHGVPISDVRFHEVGGWDSVADVIGAAIAIDFVKDATWSYSALPLGSGYIKSAHGLLPVPAPATALLLKGFACRNDSVSGERVTPTGAAIIKHLAPSLEFPAGEFRLRTVGHGFGTKQFSSLSNVLRVVVYDTQASDLLTDRISSLSFEIDDMTSEELGTVLEKTREQAGVLEIIQAPVFGKKNRIMISVKVLVEPSYSKSIAALILSSTTTLGVRCEEITRFIVPREIEHRTVNGSALRIKHARRPDGRNTQKVEMDDLSNLSSNCFEMRQAANKLDERLTQQDG